MRLRSSRSRAASAMRIIATLMMSAAVPWMGMLIASRSAALRTWELRLWMAGR